MRVPEAPHIAAPFVLAGLLACGDAQPEPDGDAVYLVAMAQESADAAGLVCDGIPSPALRGECAFFAAREQGHPEGLFLCPDGDWGRLCRFELYDRGGLIGEEARAACAGLGDIEDQCRSHALQRELEALAETEPPWDVSVFADYGIEEDAVVLAALHAATGEPCLESSEACGLVDDVLATWAGEDRGLDKRLGAWRMRQRPRWERRFPAR
ncbi:MAG TPA: hypothetical protein QGF58_17780 [Myxococcota bacterium]|nr:hypothetical protein [Myxococcota bacterium]